MTHDERTEATLQDVAETTGDAAVTGLVGQILIANARQVNHIFDQLHSAELRQRLAHEVLISTTLDAAEYAFGGTVREYESVLDILRTRMGWKSDEELARMHPEYQRWANAMGGEF